MTLLLVREEKIRHPHSIGFGECEILESSSEIVKFESFVQPLFAEGQLHAVFL